MQQILREELFKAEVAGGGSKGNSATATASGSSTATATVIVNSHVVVTPPPNTGV